ncbi:MAG TPA: hypothetical protein VF764_04635, partial [Steroidobacteraceae bacterium]
MSKKSRRLKKGRVHGLKGSFLSGEKMAMPSPEERARREKERKVVGHVLPGNPNIPAGSEVTTLSAEDKKRLGIRPCCLCGKEMLEKEGNNPWPIKTEEGARCCNDCDQTKVMAARLQLREHQQKEHGGVTLRPRPPGDPVEIHDRIVQGADSGAKTPEQIRQVVVGFYQSAITACLREKRQGIRIVMASNQPEKDWPECVTPKSVIDEAIAIINDSGVHPHPHKHGILTPKEKEQWREQL